MNIVEVSKQGKSFDKYYVFDDPIPYKELSIYPVTMLDYINFHFAVNCLLLEKNRVPDPRIIRMSYLEYLHYLINQNEEGRIFGFMLLEVIEICLKISSDKVAFVKDENGKIKLQLNGVIYDKKDFDEITKIICDQNMIDMPDYTIDPNVEKALKEAKEYMSRHQNKTKMCSLENQIVCVMISTNLNLEDIKMLSLRKFYSILERVDKKLHYQIYKQASMSGMVEMKQEIDHWMSETAKDKYSDVIVDYEGFKGKINNGGQ
jgi:hypothetical protein